MRLTKANLSFFKRIIIYFSKSSIHGLKYIAQADRHITERIFWALACSVATYATVLLLVAAHYNSENSPVSFVVSSAYLDWNTSFPAVSLCETGSLDKIDLARKRLYGVSSSKNLLFYVNDIAYFRGICESCEYRCSYEFNCTEDYETIVNAARLKLEDLILQCAWNDVPFNCSEKFALVSTELGPCYTMNSFHSNMKLNDFVSNRQIGLGKLKLSISTTEVRVFIHPHEDKPFPNTYIQPQIDINGFESFVTLLKIVEIENDPNLRSLAISKRKCRFPDENYLKYSKWYSYSGCIEECRLNHTIALCNCTHHFQPRVAGVQRCSVAQLTCLTRNDLYLRKLKSPGEMGMECNCMGTCIESEYSKIKTITVIFWSVVCSAAVYATFLLVSATWYNFQHNAVSFVVETSYLDWNTTFPTVTICENEAPDKIFDFSRKLFGKVRNMNLDFYLRDITFFDGTCNSCSMHCGITMNCTEDLDMLINELRSGCANLIGSCYWNGRQFDCCKHFLPLITELGVCYSLNSLQTKKYSSEWLDLVSNKYTGPGFLNMMVYESVKVFIHAEEDVPYLNHPQDEKAVLNWGLEFEMTFQVNEIENDQQLQKVSVEQRNCRFPSENPFNLYKFYSYSACVVNCRAEAQKRLCNCTHHFMPKQDGVQTCDIKGLTCLSKHSEMLRALRTSESKKKGLVCNCMSSCSEPEYTVISKISSRVEDIYGSKISIIMDNLPSQRFKRNVVRSRLDL
ncbi:uncharacterized protein LOC106664971 isoform X2 [Cimex lectularius]|nr:uncharacterized protein LOC106664971 isoform X2 [Cimex lectularius]